MIRTALWLVSEIGIGNTFTKEQHRSAFYGITQSDRRLRDLRAYGWVIHTSADDLTLNPEEQRFVLAGIPVWESGRRKKTTTDILTAKMRMTALAANNYQCVLCGIAGGENYPDAPHMTAILGVSRRTVTVSEGRVQTMFVPECKRCRSGVAAGSFDIPQLLDEIRSLDAASQALFVRWTQRGRQGALERIWADFWRLPPTARDQVRERLNQEPSA